MAAGGWRALHPSLAASTPCPTHTAPLSRTTKGQRRGPHILVAGGEPPSPKPSARWHRALLGCGGCWVPDAPCAVCRLQGNRRKKTPKPGSGIHVVPEHPRWFSPGSKRGESCVTERKQEHRAMGTGCVRPKPGTKARFPNSYLKPGDWCLLSVSYIKSGFFGSPSVCSHSMGAASPVSAPRGEVA